MGQKILPVPSKKLEETTILFNNAIHPGEPDGINACLIWLEELLNNKKH